jgi:transposase-like protein
VKYLIKRFALEDLTTCPFVFLKGSGKPLSGKDGILTPLVKKLTEAALEAELEHHLNNDNEEENNRRNGKSSKMMKFTSGVFELNVPRERNGTFEPQFVKKYQNTL